ncbi:MAG: DUF4132 domain-containing protein, partial [Anaerolineales bacterium]|nr:DUF4132 domain-containing protein [Anaerolineales bacterium]
TRDELADRLVPDCELDAHGRRVFDYGRRQFSFVLTGDLKPMVRDEHGKLRANPPQPGKLDDDVLAPQAYEGWKLLKKQVRETAKVQAVRLEQALVSQRRWSGADFERFLVKQPLMIHLTRLLLWGAATADGATRLFRVTEEQDYADVDDDELLLDPSWQIGLVHPLALDGAVLSEWGELFSDYELVPPFPQLAREVYRLTAEEKGQLEWHGLAEAEINGRSLMSGLIGRGWERGYPQDAGMVYGHSKWFAQAGLTAVVEYEGLYIESPDWGNPQGIQRCFFVPRRYIPDYGYRGQDKIPLGDVDPLIVSEVWRDLYALAGKTS